MGKCDETEEGLSRLDEDRLGVLAPQADVDFGGVDGRGRARWF